MLRNLGATVAIIAALACTAFTAQAPSSDSSQPSGARTQVELRLERDGKLTVVEHIVVPPDTELNRNVPLRVPAAENTERLFTVSDVSLTGPGSAEVDGDELIVRAGAGKSALRYTVDGAVVNVIGSQEVRWQIASGWDTELARVTATMVTPARNVSIKDCFAGPIGSASECTLAKVPHVGGVQLEQVPLAAGDRVDLVISLPTGTVPANARIEETDTVARAFAITVPTAIVFGLLALALLAGGVYIWFARRRDARALSTDPGPIDVLVHDRGRVYFASPDGVLPGQVGTVGDGTVDPVDIVATLVDLAVRNYLWIVEVPGPGGRPDWQITARNAPDEQLHDFERALYAAILPAGSDTVTLSALRGARVDLEPVRRALYDDALRQRWLTSRATGKRDTLAMAAAGATAAGALLTVVLALTIGHALIGIALLLASRAFALGVKLLPGRTARGRALVEQIRGLVDYLHVARAQDLPPGDQETVFSRSLPYAVVLGHTERWFGAFTSLDPAADGDNGVYWFGGFEGHRDLRAFAARFPAFLAALDAALAGAEGPSPARTPAHAGH